MTATRLLRVFNLVLAACLVLFAMPAAAAPAATPEIKIALVMKALSNPFFVNMEKGAKDYAAGHGIALDTYGVERESDVDQQISIVEGLISRGYKAIVLAPADSKRLVPVCKQARDKGVIVINIDNPLSAEALAAAKISIPFVGSDNRRGAEMIGRYVRDRLHKQGKVILIEGIRGAMNADLRKAGFIAGLQDESKIEIVASESANWHTDEALAVATKLLAQHPDVDAILCANDSMALGVLKALGNVNTTKKVIVASYDNIEDARAEIRNGRLMATIEQHPELMGRYGVILAAQGLAGKQMPATTTTPLDLITAEAFGKKIGLSISTTKTEFFAHVRDGSKNAAELFGATLLVADAGNDSAQQLADVRKWIEQKVDIILINPVHAQDVAAVVLLAKAANIPVITVDRGIAADNITSHVASDNIAGGRIAGTYLSGRLGGHGSLLELAGTAGTSTSNERSEGFRLVIKQKAGISIDACETADFDRAAAEAAVTRLLQAGRHFDGVFAHNDEMILGAAAAYRKHGGPRPILVGFDGIPDASKAVTDGNIDATVAQQPGEMGRVAVLTAVRILRQETVSPTVAVDLELLSR